MARVGQVIAVLPDEYYTQIGAILAKWATLEYMMMTIIWKQFGLSNKEGRVLCIGMGTQPLCGILRNIRDNYTPADANVKQGLVELIKFVDDAKESRNFLAHGIWTGFPDDPLPYLNFMKDKDHRILPAAQAVKPEELKNFSRVLDAMIHLASQIAGKLGADSSPPSPETPGEQNPAGLPTQTQIAK
jgi:hypothetical protein